MLDGSHYQTVIIQNVSESSCFISSARIVKLSNNSLFATLTMNLATFYILIIKCKRTRIRYQLKNTFKFVKYLSCILLFLFCNQLHFLFKVIIVDIFSRAPIQAGKKTNNLNQIYICRFVTHDYLAK